MDVLDLLWSLAALVTGPFLVLVPLVAARWVSDSLAHTPVYGRWRGRRVAVAGVVIGGCLLAVTPLPGEPLTFDSVFAKTSPWNLSVADFCVTVAEGLDAAPDALARRLADDDERLNLTVLLASAAALTLVPAAAGLARFRGGLALALIVTDLAAVAFYAGLTFYGGALALWLGNRLNFWVFALALLALQEYRYNALGLFPRHRHVRLPPVALPLGAPSSDEEEPS